MTTVVTKPEDETNAQARVDVVELEELDSGPGTGSMLADGNLEVIKNVKVELEVVLGCAEMEVGELFNLKSKNVIKLDRLINAPMDVRLDNNVVARGELVAVDDNFGIRITEITSWK